MSPVVSVRPLQIDVPEGKEVVFISDVHLGFGDRSTDKERENRLIHLLRDIRSTCCHLIIVGDLFDTAWIVALVALIPGLAGMIYRRNFWSGC